MASCTSDTGAPPATHLLTQAPVTGRSGKAGAHLHRRPRRPRGRAALAALAAAALLGLAAGCGGGEEDQAAQTSPAPVSAVATSDQPAPTPPVRTVSVGGTLEPSREMPTPLRRALERGQVAVVGFVLPGVAEDERVVTSLQNVRESAGRQVHVLIYRVGGQREIGQIAERLGVEGTPTVVVIGRDRTLVNVFHGLVDAAILSQSIEGAKDREPVREPRPEVRPSSDAGPSGDARGPSRSRGG